LEDGKPGASDMDTRILELLRDRQNGEQNFILE